MKTEQSLNAEALQAYQVLCGFCATMLYEDLDPEKFERVCAQAHLLLEAPFSDVSPKAAYSLYCLLKPAQAGKQGAELFDEVHRDRSYLFYMIGASHTSPYESVYRTDDRTLFGPTTHEVRASYHAHGLVLRDEANQPEDHIGLEFAFLGHLLGQMFAAHESGGVAAKQGAHANIRGFLTNHFLVFAPVYLGNLHTRANSEYYRAIANIALHTTQSLALAFDAEAVERIDENRYVLPS